MPGDKISGQQLGPHNGQNCCQDTKFSGHDEVVVVMVESKSWRVEAQGSNP